MWALRRASVHLRNQCLSSGAARICSVKSEIESCYFENYITGFTQSQVKTSFYNECSSSKYISSLAGGKTKSSGDDNGALGVSSSLTETRLYDESIFEFDLSAGESVGDELDVLEAEGDGGDMKSAKTEPPSELAKVLLSVPAKETARVLDEWIEAGNEVTPTEVSSTVLYLQNCRLFGKIFQRCMHLHYEPTHFCSFTNGWSPERKNDYADRVDSIAKVQGSLKAEAYIQRIPESFRTETVYCSLLRDYVIACNVYESEKLFNKMKDLFPLTVASCNQMLHLYKRTDRKKIANIWSFMEKEHIKPSDIMYQILIDVEGLYGSINGMEQIFETMKSNGVEPSLRNRASMARSYAAGNLKDKAEAILKDMEGGGLVKNRAAWCFVLPVYASLGRDDEVGRIWKECEASNPTQAECIAAIKAWGKLGRVKEAEAAFAKMLKILSRHSSRHYAFMLDVYANHKMMTEGEDLFRRMRENVAIICVHAWDALVKLYIRVGELEKADAALEEAIQGRVKPNFSSFSKILERYAARGDVQNTEKISLKMREAGLVMRPKTYCSLLYAYIKAKAPVDGIDDRLRRDRVVPDQKLARLLARVAAFR